MRKTGNMKFASRFFLFSLLLFLPLFALSPTVTAQSVDVSASVNQRSVFQGERIVYTIRVSGDFNDLSEPELPQLRGLQFGQTRPSVSRSQSISIINGEFQKTITFDYSYPISTPTEGRFTIPAANLTIDGKQVSTNSITVTVRARDTSADQPGDEQPDIFVQLELSNKNPVVGEEIVAKVVLYFRENIEILSYQPQSGWKAEGFWKEVLDDGRQPRAVSSMKNGIRYREASLIEYALFPTKSGELTISPFEISTTVRYERRRRDSFSSFFSGFGSNQRNVDLQTEPVTIEAVALENPPDAQFISAVGDFDISRSISQQEMLVGESLELVTTIKGRGNVPLISKPDYQKPDGFEIYNPKESSEVNRKNGHIVGEYTFTDIMIPRTPGSFTIPKIILSSYNPDRKRFEKTTLPSYTVTVKPDPNRQIASGDKTLLNVKPVLGLVSWEKDQSGYIWNTTWFPIIALLPFLITAGAYARKRYLDKLHGDEQFARSTKADAVAKERIEQAQSTGKEHLKDAYGFLHKALAGYISDKLYLPASGLSDKEYVEAVADKLTQQQKNQLKRILTTASTIQFAPNPGNEAFQKDLEETEQLIKELKKAL